VSLSIIIPVYEMPTLLELGVSQVAESLDDTTEIIIVDDGSSEATAAVGRRLAEQHRQVGYVYRPRDEQSGRATARNLGIARAKERTLLFLDAGVLLSSHFLEHLRADAARSPDALWLFEVFGLNVGRAEGEALLPPRAWLQDRNIIPWVWRDPRTPLFRSVDGQLQRLAAPWTLGWTCALAIPSDVARAIGGFDVQFKKWGAEDVEFAYRAVRAGLTPTLGRGYGIHLPHDSKSKLEAKVADAADNKRLLLSLHANREHELFTCTSSLAVNMAARYLDGIILEHHVAPVPSDVTDELTRRLPSARAAASVFPSAASAAALPVSKIFAHSEAAARALGPASRLAECRLGIELPLPSRHFEWTLCFDAVRTMPALIRRAQLAELLRVSEALYFCLGPDGTSLQSSLRELSGVSWVAAHELHRELEELGATIYAEPLSCDFRLLKASRRE
jgi:glycosyltransferase involved in cell wall biosynthesis